jgi:hypothetical protein
LTVVNKLRVGVLSGAGTVTQNAGTVTVGTAVELGSSADPNSTFIPSGTYTLSGGALNAPALTIGSAQPDARGVLNLSGSGRVDVDRMDVGVFFGVGTVNQSGGMGSVGRLQLGITSSQIFPPPGTGIYNLSGGMLTCDFTDVALHSVLNITGGAPNLGGLFLEDDGRVNVSGGGNKVVEASYVFFRSNHNAVLDLTDNRMDVGSNGGSAQLDELRNELARGYNGGSWTGKGITSATAAANSSSAHPTALGFAIVPGVPYRVKYTYYGDANLDGQVDVSDLGILATNWQSASGFWYTGDFNYDRLVNVEDLGLLATNWQAGVGNPLGPQSLATALHELGLPDASLPEPVSDGTIGLCLATAALRRRARRRPDKAWFHNDMGL